jgi:hypothetical protein
MEIAMLSTMTESLTSLNSTSSERDISDRDSSLEYQLRQLEHSNQLFTSLDADDATCFAVCFRSTTAAMRSKPHISIEKVLAGREREVVSSIRFNPGPTKVPWVPRAFVTYANEKRQETMQMKSPLSLKWHVLIGSTKCTWGLSYIPPSLVLNPRDDPKQILARFTYAGYGNRAQNGQVVGFLRIMENGGGHAYQAQIMSTISAVIAHWKSAGKFLLG